MQRYALSSGFCESIAVHSGLYFCFSILFHVNFIHPSIIHLSINSSSFYLGKPLLSFEHPTGPDHQTKRHPLCWVHNLHEGSESHAHPHPSAGSSVHPFSLEAGGTHQPDHLWFLCKYLLPLPGTADHKLHIRVSLTAVTQIQSMNILNQLQLINYGNYW